VSNGQTQSKSESKMRPIVFFILLTNFFFRIALSAQRKSLEVLKSNSQTLLTRKLFSFPRPFQDLPRAESLQSREVSNNNVVQDLSKDEMNKPNKKDETNPDDVESVNSENSIDEDDSNDLMRKIRVKMPLDFDLTELAHNILMNNQK
jgi:hypothetical protein